MADFSYPGEELELFRAAVNWKAYWTGMIRSEIRGRVLEVGAGAGANTEALLAGATSCEEWIALEPDPTLCARTSALTTRFASLKVVRADLSQWPWSDVPSHKESVQEFDTVLYLDVLEHIEDDAGELARVARVLRPGGKLVILAPAHRWLYSAFDRALGHFRRYDQRSLRAVMPEAFFAERSLRYLDSCGTLLSLGNRLVARKPLPSASDLRLWDRLVVPFSKRLDPVLGYTLGKSILGVWERKA